jgi:hypothetical protein
MSMVFLTNSLNNCHNRTESTSSPPDIHHSSSPLSLSVRMANAAVTQVLLIGPFLKYIVEVARSV